MKIALGTAQLGFEYGIANTVGRVSHEDASRILDLAERGGVKILDTAPAYGDSEEVLGSFRAAERFAIVTKTVRLGAKGAAAVIAAFERSLERLRATTLHALFVHAAADLGGAAGRELARLLQGLRQSGRVQRVGVSVYSAAEIRRALDVLELDAIQVPVNVLDQRLVADGTLGRLKTRGIEVHARSAFLQGVLVSDAGRLPAYFDPIRPRLAAWRSFCRARGLTPLRAALGFVCGIAAIDHVVCGVESVTQLEEVLAAAQPLDPAEFRELALDDPDFVDPSRWRISV